MKRTLLMILSVMVIAGAAAAQDPGNIDIFADDPPSTCNITDAAPGLLPVHIFHTNSAGVKGSQWRVVTSAGISWTYAGEIVFPTLAIGNTQDGIALTYPGCVPGPYKLVTINYFGSGDTPPCEYVRIEADPTVAGVLGLDCSNIEYNIGQIGGTAFVNDDGSCTCNPATEKSTWGKVKALYKK